MKVFFKCFSLSLISVLSLSIFEKTSYSAIQKTFGMIKPSGMEKQQEIKSIIASHNLRIIQQKKVIMTEKLLNKLYFMHKKKPFWNDLQASLLNKEVIPMVIYGENAVENYRNAVNDIRAKYALNKTENAVHGSDSWLRAHEEICIFFDCGKRKDKQVKKDEIKTENIQSATKEETQTNNSDGNAN